MSKTDGKSISVSNVIPNKPVYDFRKMWSNFNRITLVLSFIAPAFILYVIFMLYPMGDAVRLSFYDWNGSTPTMNFVGVENFIKLAEDGIYKRALFNNFSHHGICRWNDRCALRCRN